MKILYWNTNNILSVDQISDICSSESPDIFFLSEIDENILDTNNKLLIKIGYKHYPNPGSERVKIVIKSDLNIELGIQSKYYSVVIIPDIDLNVVSLHLPSQMFQHMDALKEFIREFRKDIDNNIGNPIDERIIVIGDFNVNPFEKPMIDFDGFSATNTINSRKKITNLKISKSLYYNPTWKLYSNNKFPGTKYFQRPSGASYDVLEHHFLDQVVISTKLLSEIKSEKINVITKSANYIYYKLATNKILESDHLPLSYQIKL